MWNTSTVKNILDISVTTRVPEQTTVSNVVCFDEMKHIFRHKILNFLTFYALSDIVGTPAFDIQRNHPQILIKILNFKTCLFATTPIPFWEITWVSPAARNSALGDWGLWFRHWTVSKQFTYSSLGFVYDCMGNEIEWF